VLGDSQSGEMTEIGFQLYSDMLNEAVRSLKAGKEPDRRPLASTTRSTCTCRPCCRLLRRRARAPVVYKRLANCATQEKIDDIQEELIDRFGKLPDAVKALVETHRLRIAAKTVGIIKIDAHTEAANLQFMAKPPIDPMRIIGLIQKNRHIKLHGQDKLKITAAMPDLAARVTQIKPPSSN
jgi:transcription-repair coupling factor (superfamily II helicase)